MIRWLSYFKEDDAEIYLQIWRSASAGCSESYELIGQTYVRTSIGKFNQTLSQNESISVQGGDVLGIFFLSSNPVAFSSEPCYSLDERIRYNQYQEGPVDVGVNLPMKIPSLSWEPCTAYSLQAFVGR